MVGVSFANHGAIEWERGYYSKLWLRRIFDANQGASQCVVWEQVLPPGGYIVPHFHYFEEVLSFLGGVAEVQVGTERRTIGAGTSVLLPVETVHQVRTVGEEPVRVLAFLATIDPLVQYLESPSPVAWEAGDEVWRPL